PPGDLVEALLGIRQRHQVRRVWRESAERMGLLLHAVQGLPEIPDACYGGPVRCDLPGSLAETRVRGGRARVRTSKEGVTTGAQRIVTVGTAERSVRQPEIVRGDHLHLEILRLMLAVSAHHEVDRKIVVAGVTDFARVDFPVARLERFGGNRYVERY